MFVGFGVGWAQNVDEAKGDPERSFSNISN